MPFPRSGAAAVVVDAHVYVIGGIDANGNVSNRVDRYNPATNTWDTAPPMINARFNAAAVASNNKIFVMGGRGNNGIILDKAETFDPAQLQWRATANLNAGREGLAGILLENTVYVLGGSDGNEQILNTVEYYDEAANQWRNFSGWEGQVAKASFASVSLADSAYSFGGFSAFGPLGLTRRYNTAGVAEKASFQPARGGLSAAVLASAIYIIGGRVGSNEVVNTVNRFFPAENKWELAQPLNQARTNAPAVSINNQIFVFGGSDAQGQITGSVEAFDTIIPPAAIDDFVFTTEDATVTFDVLKNDSDPAGGAIQITGFTQPLTGTITQTNSSSFTYQPEQDFFGDVTFTYTITNAAGGIAQATVQLLIDPVQDPPTFTTSPITSALVDLPYLYEIRTADPDFDAHTITSSPLPAWLQFEDQESGLAFLGGTPTAEDIGQYTIEIFVSDGADTASQLFLLTVVADAPAVPTLLSPVDGAGVSGSTISFTWSEVALAMYHFQLASTPAFDVLVVDSTINEPTLVIEGLNDETYFWRVSAFNAAGVSDWSDVYSFGTFINVSNEIAPPLADFELNPAYPNPFREVSSIPFIMHTRGGQAEVVVFDINGRKITTLVSGFLPPGKHHTLWDGRDARGDKVASGSYVVQLRIDNQQQTRVLMFIR